MDGLWVLLLLLFTAALPVFLAYLWFRAERFPLSRRWFLLSFLTGVLALPLAALTQQFFPPVSGPGERGPAAAFLGVFIRIALTEEAARFLALFLLFRVKGRAAAGKPENPFPPPPAMSAPAFGAASGLLAGLGFALVENAWYGAADIGLTLLRAFTAAPLHGACGARVGLAAGALREAPARALARFCSAVLIHGMYNFMILRPGIPPVIPVLIALSALASSVQAIHRS
jgi:RsiW-degrading membrane proteinase PrsW (M82 family)